MKYSQNLLKKGDDQINVEQNKEQIEIAPEFITKKLPASPHLASNSCKHNPCVPCVL